MILAQKMAEENSLSFFFSSVHTIYGYEVLNGQPLQTERKVTQVVQFQSHASVAKYICIYKDFGCWVLKGRNLITEFSLGL